MFVCVDRFDSCGATAETDDSEDVTRIAQFTTDTAPIPAVPEVFPENVSEVIQKATECHDDCDTTGASPKPHQDKEEKDEDQESGNAILESASHPEEDSLQLVERRNSVRYRLREHSLNDSEDPEQTLFYATQMGFSSTVQKLCSRYRPFLSPASLRHALSIAARQGHASLVSILLEAGADPDIADSEGWTPLRASAWGGHASAVQVLHDSITFLSINLNLLRQTSGFSKILFFFYRKFGFLLIGLKISFLQFFKGF